MAILTRPKLPVRNSTPITKVEAAPEVPVVTPILKAAPVVRRPVARPVAKIVAPSAVQPQVLPTVELAPEIAPIAAEKVPFDIDAACAEEPRATLYGVDLRESMQRLYKLVAREGVDLAQLKDGFLEVNRILVSNPALCTEIMLPADLGQFCLAAQKLSEVSIQVGTERQTKAAINKKDKIVKQAATAQMQQGADEIVL